MTHSIQDLIQLSEKLHPTGLLPDHIKTPGQALAVMLAGQELGMAPMQSFRCLQLVKGKVVESADSQLGRFKAMGGKANFTKLTESEAVLELTHSNGDTHTERFTMEDAKRARLAGGQNWSSYPKAMLRSRVITAGLKSIGWDGASGAYDPDEAKEIGAPRVVSSLPAPVSESAARKALEAPRSEAEVESEAKAAFEGICDPEPILVQEEGDTYDASTGEVMIEAAAPAYITEAQRRALWAAARKGGVSEEELRLKLSTMGVESTKQIPQSSIDGLLDWCDGSRA